MFTEGTIYLYMRSEKEKKKNYLAKTINGHTFKQNSCNQETIIGYSYRTLTYQQGEMQLLTMAKWDNEKEIEPFLLHFYCCVKCYAF